MRINSRIRCHRGPGLQSLAPGTTVPRQYVWKIRPGVTTGTGHQVNAMATAIEVIGDYFW